MPIFGMGKKKSGTPQAARTQTSPAAAWAAAAATATATASAGAPAPRRLPDDGDTELTRLLGIAASRDWDALRGEFARVEGNDLSSLLSNVCARTPEIGEWVPNDAGDALAQAVLGADAIERGWRVRTGKRATQVSEEQFREFHRLLRVAEEYLYASVELDATSVAPWYSLQISGRGLEVGLDVQQRRFEGALKRCPGHLGSHRQMLQQLCRKWGGSHEQMHAFATEAMQGPYGDVLGQLIPMAYFEHLSDLEKDSPERGFIRSAESRAELLQAAERTIFRPGYSFPRGPYLAANQFLWAFTRAGMWPQAKQALDATENTAVTWGPATSDPAKHYTQLRATVLKNV